LLHFLPLPYLNPDRAWQKPFKFCLPGAITLRRPVKISFEDSTITRPIPLSVDRKILPLFPVTF